MTTSSTSSAYHPAQHPTLRRFAQGEAVARLQRRLTAHLPNLPASTFVDAQFGPETEKQLKKFQQQAGLQVDGVAGERSWRALLAAPAQTATPQSASNTDRAVAAAQPGTELNQLQRCLKRLGHQYLDDGQAFHLNLVGIRSPSAHIDSFDDELWLSYRDEQLQPRFHRFALTTDPGKTYTQEQLLNPAGAAILQPGQYLNVYQIGRHNNKYQALCQSGGEVRIWRDANRDAVLDRGGKTYQGYFGINIHRASSSASSKVGAYSAGCQVLQKASDFDLLMALANKSRQLRGNHFSYTLLNQTDL